MDSTPNLGSYVRALSKSGTSEGDRPAPYVTISRESGAGGREVGEAITRLLNEHKAGNEWKLYDRELVDAIMQDHKLNEELRDALEEEQISRLNDWIASVLERRPPQVVLAGQTAETLRSIALRGHAVILGRGGGVLTRDLPQGLHVRLIAPKEIRLARKQAQVGMEGKSIDQEELDRIDNARAAYVRSYWGADPTDAHNYDIVLNTHCLGINACAELIANMMLSCSGKPSIESDLDNPALREFYAR